MIIKRWFVGIFIFCSLSAFSGKESNAPQAEEIEKVELSDPEKETTAEETKNIVCYLNEINTNYIKVSTDKFADTDPWINDLTEELGEVDFSTLTKFFKNFNEHLTQESLSYKKYKETHNIFATCTLTVGSVAAGGILAAAGVLAFVGGFTELSQLSCNDWHCPDGLHKVDTSPWACYSAPLNRDCAKEYVAQFPYGHQISPQQVVYMTHCGEGWTEVLNGNVIPYEEYLYDIDDHCRKLAGAIPFIPAEALVLAAVGTEVVTLAGSAFFFLKKECCSPNKEDFSIDPDTSLLLRKVQQSPHTPSAVNGLIKQAFKRAGGAEEYFYTGEVDDPLLESQENRRRPGFLRRTLLRLMGKLYNQNASNTPSGGGDVAAIED